MERDVSIALRTRFLEQPAAALVFARRAHETEFFIRKAIGWALRQHAYVRQNAVKTFILGHRRRFSGLTMREAGKHLKLPA